MANKPQYTFRSEQFRTPVRKDRVSKMYSLIGGFLKIVRQKGSKKLLIMESFLTRMC